MRLVFENPQRALTGAGAGWRYGVLQRAMQVTSGTKALTLQTAITEQVFQPHTSVVEKSDDVL
jgi:hypothetical protein